MAWHRLATIFFLCAVLGAGIALAGVRGAGYAAGAPEGEWSEPLNLSRTPDQVSRYPSIAVDGQGNVHVVWIEEFDQEGNRSIYYARKGDDGWTEPIDILCCGWWLVPELAVDSKGMLYLAYVGGGERNFWRASAGGETWSARAWSSPSSPGCGGSLFSDRLDRLHSLCKSTDYSVSEDGGNTWSEPMPLSTSGEPTALGIPTGSGVMSADSRNTLYAIWLEGEGFRDTSGTRLMFARLPAGEADWAVSTLVGDQFLMGLAAEPRLVFVDPLSIVVDGQDRLHVFWRSTAPERTAWAIYHQISLDGGDTWSPAVPVVKSEAGEAWRYGGIATAVDSLGRVHLVFPWKDAQLYHMVWDGAWSEPVNVSRNPGKVNFWPRLAIGLGNQAHLVWYTGSPQLNLPDLEQRLARGEYEIMYSHTRLDAPALPPQPYAVTVTSTPTMTSTPEPTATAAATPTPLNPTLAPFAGEPNLQVNTSLPMLIALAASVAVVGIAIVVRLASLGRR